ncbi:MAG: hypothetical protein AAGI68_04955 [Planctomycetota bacterium]
MDRAVELVVFADDWGRHPSSAQHLVRELLRQGLVERVVWVNTIGMRKPRLRWGDVKRGLKSLRGNSRRATPRRLGDDEFGQRLRVVSPRMYPGFRNGWQRRFNARAMRRAVEAAVSVDETVERVGLTTLPITADLIGAVPAVGRWVYYCVDDFSVWPGVDHGVMERMEPELVRKADAVVCVSEVLRSRVEGILGVGHHGGTEGTEVGGVERQDAKTPRRQAVALLTHGVDLKHWQRCDRNGSSEGFLFWGLLDERLDRDWVDAVVDCGERITLVGPTADGWIGVMGSGVDQMGPVALGELPGLADRHRVLVMPYRDLPVTRAMQPLKLLEYLATYKPVVVRDLPATRGWGDCCDVVSTAEQFVRVCRERAEGGLPPEQRAARERRLVGESWSEKARVLHRVLRGGAGAGR